MSGNHRRLLGSILAYAMFISAGAAPAGVSQILFVTSIPLLFLFGSRWDASILKTLPFSWEGLFVGIMNAICIPLLITFGGWVGAGAALTLLIATLLSIHSHLDRQARQLKKEEELRLQRELEQGFDVEMQSSTQEERG